MSQSYDTTLETDELALAGNGVKKRVNINWKRCFFLFLGMGLFALIYWCPPWPDAIDPMGKHFTLSQQGKGALALFALAATWWIFEVLPIGVTGIAIGVIQAMFLIRKPDVAFKDFMDPSVLFIFGSIVIGLVFTKSGLTKRMAYKMLSIVGERTSMIYLGCFVMTVALTHLMAHTAVAATMFPLLMAINALYSDDDQPSKFGKGLFIGMAYVAGAGSIITLLGSARAAVGIAFFKEMTGVEISFFELTYYFVPLGWLMMFAIWGMMMVLCKPEKRVIPGLKEKAKRMYAELGGWRKEEIMTLVIVLSAICLIAAKNWVPALKTIDKTAILLTSTLLFFTFNILKVEDLEDIPWNIILLFGGAMSIGFCLWQTHAAEWLAVNWLALFKEAPAIVFILGIAIFVLVMTNFIMNVAAIAISLPVALVIAPYLGVAGHVIFFSSLAAAGMPFFLLIGAAPNAIAYGSRQFTAGEFFRYGVMASVLLMVVIWVFVTVVWPLMGMPILLTK